MRISKLRPMVMGTPWRNLTFLVVETDEGLSGVGEVRMLNHTDALFGYLQEAAPNYVLGQDPFNVEQIFDQMYRHDFAAVGRDRDERYRRRGGRLLGYRGQGAQPACLPADGRRHARAHQGLCQRLVYRRAHARRIRCRSPARRGPWLPRGQARSFWCRVLRARTRGKAAVHQPGRGRARRCRPRLRYPDRDAWAFQSGRRHRHGPRARTLQARMDSRNRCHPKTCAP